MPLGEKSASKFSYTRELTGDRNWSDMLGHFFSHLSHLVGHMGSLGHNCQEKVATSALR